MDPAQYLLLQRSFTKVARSRAEAGRYFYDRLFEIAPELRPMFKSDLRSQAQKLVDTLAALVGLLRYEDMLLHTLRGLGERHAAYGVSPEHYGAAGAALLLTLEHALGADFTPELRTAWTALYDRAATVMQEASRREAA